MSCSKTTSMHMRKALLAVVCVIVLLITHLLYFGATYTNQVASARLIPVHPVRISEKPGFSIDSVPLFHWNVYNPAQSDQCKYVDYKPRALITSNGTRTCVFCARVYSDSVSNAIKHSGVWGDCESLYPMFNFVRQKRSEIDALNNSLFLDVGGNIGSCSISMLCSMNRLQANHRFSVLAFEPLQSNLFYFRGSITANNFGNIALVECGVGAKSEKRRISVTAGNEGDSTIIAQNGSGAAGQRVSDVCIVRVDDVVSRHFNSNSAAFVVPVLKMDIQGFEENAMKGMSALFADKRVYAIKTEFAPPWILRTGLQPLGLLMRFEAFGFNVYRNFDLTGCQSPESKIECPFKNRIAVADFTNFSLSLGNTSKGFTDIYGLLRGLCDV